MSIHDDIAGASHRAFDMGALKPIETRIERLDEGGINWIVRVVERLSEKPVGFHGKTRSVQGESAAQPGSPWLPPDPGLMVTALTDSHIVILNKFPVIDNHALIVTRAYEDQQVPLTVADFEALTTAMNDWPGAGALGFYNGGRIAGASQGHKHLQLVSLPLAEGDIDPLPVNPRADDLPFRRALAALNGSEPAEKLLTLYHQLRDELRLETQTPYNLLITRQWMMLVPRQREHFQNLSINSLGFAGCLLARNDTELNIIRDIGPAAILRAVT